MEEKSIICVDHLELVVTTIILRLLNYMIEWTQRKQLSGALHKTEAVLLVYKTKAIDIKIGDALISSQPNLKYLGVHLDKSVIM